MLFFNRKKPKQFNYKPLYSNEEQNEKELLTNKMFNRWNRAPYSELLKQGNKKVKYTIAIICLLIYAGITFYDYLIQRL